MTASVRLVTLSALRTTVMIAVGTLITERPPHNTVRAAFPHTAPTSGG
jgi:hypothetical protein